MRRLLLALVLVVGFTAASAAPPRLLVTEPGFGLELIAKEPDIVTPIGMAFDKKGRLLVVESHTHQRPADYQGPAGDRVRMFADTDGDGRLDTWTTFAEGYQQAMNLCVRPDGAVYLVTRRDVKLLEDTNDDGVSDKETVILHLETTGDYPHNGMSGIAFMPISTDRLADGNLVIGIGENSGIPYTLVGSDGAKIEMRDGAGNVYGCRADGSKLVRIATGFWNPFALCKVGRNTYCADNDPDASPPCRLVEVWPAGDYGFRYQYGRAGVHPLEAWNGELPGTLPPVCGVGEAPTALVYHHDFLWVTSWGDHRIERYASQFSGTMQRPERSAARQVIVQGDEDFRPTGCAVAPDGSLYFGDWVSRSYPVHGHGRIWRLSLPMAERDRPPAPGPFTSNGTTTGPMTWGNADSFAEVQQLTYVWEGKGINERPEDWHDHRPSMRVFALQHFRQAGTPQRDELLRQALHDDLADARLYAVRWICDEKLPGYRDDVAKLLEGDVPTERYYLAVLAAVDWLDGKPIAKNGAISDELLVRELENDKRSAHLHALALRLVSPDDKWLTIERLRGFLASDSAELRLEAVRTLAMQTSPARFDVLAEVAGDVKNDPQLRAEAVMGLGAAAEERRELFDRLAASDDVVGREAARVLRLRKHLAAGAGNDPEQAERPESTDLQAWNALLATGAGDAEAGRRLFFGSVGPQCANCHQHEGRGGRVGPDLTRIGAQQNRERIVASILQPSQEIAPEFQAWTLLTADGLTRVGLRLPKGGDDGVEPYADPRGKTFKLKSEEIELRTPCETSIMPAGLVDGLTVQDLRDVVAFLSAKP